MKLNSNPAALATKISFFIIVVQFGLAVFFQRQLPPEVPVFYSRPWGENQLANTGWLIILPGISLIVTLGNLAAAKLIEKLFENKAVLAGQILTFFAPIFSFLCLYTLIRIVLLVG